MPRDESSIITMVTRILTQITNKGPAIPKSGKTWEKAEVYIVGGAARDILLKKTPRDFDFATNASVSDIVKVLTPLANTYGDSKVIKIRNYLQEINSEGEIISSLNESQLYEILAEDDSVQLRYYRPMVSAQVYNSKTKRTWDFEIASYQIYQPPLIDDDGNYQTNTLMVKSLEEHLSNSDFTINSLAIDKDGKIEDFTGGLEDMKSGLIKSTSEPEEMFRNQPRTMLRAIKLSNDEGFKLDKKTESALKKVKFEELIPVRPNIKRQLINEILMTPSGIQMLNKYGITEQLIYEYGGVPSKDILKRITLGYKNLNRYMRPPQSGEIDTSKDAIQALLIYFISESYAESSVSIESNYVKDSQKQSLTPEIYKAIHYYKYFRPPEILRKQFSIFFRAIQKYLDSGIPTDLYEVKRELDSFFEKNAGLLVPKDLLNCFNSVIIPISLDKGISFDKISNKNRFLFNLYSAKYQNLLKYQDKAIKHIVSYYNITEDEASQICKDAIANVMIAKEKSASWEFILTNMLTSSKYKLSFTGDIKQIAGVLDDKKNYDYSMERIISEYCQKTGVKGPKNTTIPQKEMRDLREYIDAYEEFADELEDWEDEQVENIEFFRKVINLIIFNWIVGFTPEGKASKIKNWVNKWFSYPLDSMLFSDFEIIADNRDIKKNKNVLIGKMTSEELKTYDKLQFEYNKFMSYGHSIWNDNLTEGLRLVLDSARDKTIELLKDENAYSAFFPQKMIVDDDMTYISELKMNPGFGQQFESCPSCGGKDFMKYINPEGEDIFRCITKNCYMEIDNTKQLKYYNRNMNAKQLDWIMFYENTYVHKPVVSNIYERLQLSLSKEDRKTLNTCKNEYNEHMYNVHKSFRESYDIIDVDNPDFNWAKSATNFFEKYRRMILDINIQQTRDQLVKRDVFEDSDFDRDNSKKSDDAIYEYSLVYDWILFNSENSYKLTKIDFIRSIFNSYIRYSRKNKKFLPLQREYYDIVDNPENWSDFYGKHYKDIAMDYYKTLRGLITEDGLLIDSKYWKTNREIYKFLNDKNWFEEAHMENIVPLFYSTGKWFDLETKLGGDDKLVVLNELSTIIYSILEIHNPKSWGDVAKIYNELPIDKMEYGLLTANLAKYIYDKCIQPYVD
tara:strand:- start:8577 stop:11969 length:3393 start_codon:yes stop_codon:yes gene_type:complete